MECMKMYNDCKLQGKTDAYIMIRGTITNLKHQSNRWAFVAIPALLKKNPLHLTSEKDQVNNLNMNKFGANWHGFMLAKS